jgi:hypothetical protein
LLAGLYRLFGEGPGSFLAVDFMDSAVLVGQVVLLPLVAEALGAGVWPGFLAALLAIFGMERMPRWETNYSELLLVIAVLLACRYLRAIGPSRPATSLTKGTARFIDSPLVLASGLGLVWGTILLTNPTPALVWLCWLVLGAWYGARHAARWAWLPALLIPLVMVAPWTARNFATFHRVVPIRDNLGLELMVSNNPCASPSFSANVDSGCFRKAHPALNSEEARRVIEMGEANYNALKLREAGRWIRANPGAFCRLSLKRFLYFWLRFTPDSSGADRLRSWGLRLLTLMSIPGLLLLWRASRSGAIVCMTLLAFFPPVHYLVQYMYRYHFPTLWVMFSLSAMAIIRIASWAVQRTGLVPAVEPF